MTEDAGLKAQESPPSPRGTLYGARKVKTENGTGRDKQGKHHAQGAVGSAPTGPGTPRQNQRRKTPWEGGLNQQDRNESSDHTPQPKWKKQLLTEEGAREICGMAEARTGLFTVCHDKHVYIRKLPWGSLPWPSSRLQDCKAFRALKPTQMAIVIEGQRGCANFLSWVHTKQGCAFKELTSLGSGADSLQCQESEGTEVCGRTHHRTVHKNDVLYDLN